SKATSPCPRGRTTAARSRLRSGRTAAGAGTSASFSCPRIFVRYADCMSDAPKSAYELAMERLKKKDAEAGVVEQTLTAEQKAAIAEARSVYEARVAERQILHRDARLKTVDPAEVEKMEEEYRRDLGQFATDRDARIRRIREARSEAAIRGRRRCRARGGVGRPSARAGGRPRADPR